MVVTSSEQARDLQQKPARIASVVDSHLINGHVLFNYYLDDLSKHSECVSAGRRLWAETGLKPSDMDAAMIYENFSPIVFLQLEGCTHWIAEEQPEELVRQLLSFFEEAVD